MGGGIITVITVAIMTLLFISELGESVAGGEGGTTTGQVVALWPAQGGGGSS